MKKETARKLLGNFISLGSARLITAFLYFLLLIYLARVLGVDNFGKYEFSIAFFALFNILAVFGTDKIGTREISRISANNPDKLSRFASSLMTLKSITSFSAFIILVFVALVIPKPPDVKFLIVLNGTVILFTCISLEWFFMGTERMINVAISRILEAATFLALAVLLVKTSGALFAVPVVRILSVLLSAGYLLYIYAVRKYFSFKPLYALEEWKKLIKESAPVFVAGLLATTYVKFDAILLGFLKSDRDVGLYVAVYRIILFLTSIRLIAVDAVFPSMSRAFIKSKEELKSIVRLSQKAAIMFAIPIGIGGTILAPKVINLLYGETYMSAVPAFYILIWTFVAQGINFVFPQLEIACNKQNVYMKIMALGVLLNIVLNFLLIPGHGIVGAATATVAADILALVLFYAASRQIVKIDLIRLLCIPFCAALLMGAAIFFLKTLNMGFVILIGAIIYFALLVMMKYIKKDEIIFLVRLNSRNTEKE